MLQDEVDKEERSSLSPNLILEEGNLMMLAYAREVVEGDCFFKAEEGFDRLITILNGKESAAMTMSEIEKLIHEKLQEIGLELTEAKMNEVGLRESSEPVIGTDGVVRTQRELLCRKIETRFGEVSYKRWGYGAKGVVSLFPADGHLNLSPKKYTNEVRRLVSKKITHGSYDATREDLLTQSGAKVPKRQSLELVERAAVDFEGFYEKGSKSGGNEEKSEVVQGGSLLILTTDGKGVVMRSEGLREQTRIAAEQEKHKLDKRLSRGEKRNRKRMAQVASVYTVVPIVRTAEEVVGELSSESVVQKKRRSPRPENKRVWASVKRGTELVIEEMFKEGQDRDPKHEKQWVALVDGNPCQLKELQKKAQSFKVQLTIVLDIIHVLEYLWKAACGFYGEGSPQSEGFVTQRLLRLLRGQSSQVAKGMRKMATERLLRGQARKQVDKCADYLLKYASIVHYDQYLAQGLPIATGVIEGACRYLVKDRMEITGARWNLVGAEAVLCLRSLRASDDFQEYWQYHENRERERNHTSKYFNGLPTLRNDVPVIQHNKGTLRLVEG